MKSEGKLTGVLSTAGTLVGTLKAEGMLIGKLTAVSQVTDLYEFATEPDIIGLFDEIGGNENG